MKYQAKSFTVPASGGSVVTCQKVGHAFADVKGKCVRCGEKIRFSAFDVQPESKRRPAGTT